MSNSSSRNTVLANPCEADWERRKLALEDSDISEGCGEFTRRIAFVVGYDHRAFPDACGGGGHGQHGMEVGFYLIGALGVVQWKVSLSHLVPGNLDSLGYVPTNSPRISAVYPIDLGYHWPTPRYEGQPQFDCDLLPGGACFYDGSGLNAAPPLARFISEGPRAIWAELEAYYRGLVSREF